MRHARQLRRQGYDQGQAIASAKQIGFRRRRRDFDGIQWTMHRRLREAGLEGTWVDVLQHRPDADLLDWCVDLLPRPTALRAASTSQQAQKKRPPSAESERVRSSLGVASSLAGGERHPSAQSSSLPEGVNEYGGRLARDPARPQGQVHRSAAFGIQPGANSHYGCAAQYAGCCRSVHAADWFGERIEAGRCRHNYTPRVLHDCGSD